MIEIIDNVLPIEQHQQIKETLVSVGFPWYHQDNVSNEGDYDHFYFTHCFYMNCINSGYFQLIQPIINELKPKKKPSCWGAKDGF
mgnify:CR=1 FL=1